MSKIIIDDTEYDLESLSDEAKAQLVSIRFVDTELARLHSQMAALQTARIGYSRALKRALEEGTVPEEPEVSIENLGDNLEFE